MKNKFNMILQNRWTIPTATAVGGFSVGTLIGYFLTKKQYDRIETELVRIDKETEEIEQYQLDFREAALSAEVDRRVSIEIQKRMPEILGSNGLGYIMETNVEDEEAIKYTQEDHPSSAAKLGTVTQIRRELDPELSIKHNNPVINETPRKGVITNIFDNGAGDEWDYKIELEARNTSKPYTIHVDEYLSDEMEWDSQSTLTWYEKDRILTDSHDHPIHNPNEVVGLPLRFGHGSNDPNVVYIRNDRLQAEYEVIRDSGSYQETVLGEELEATAEYEELKHSQQMKFRQT